MQEYTMINKLKIFIHKVISYENKKNEEFQKPYNKEERIQTINNKLIEIEKSVLNYNQYNLNYEKSLIGTSIKELEKVHCEIIE